MCSENTIGRCSGSAREASGQLPFPAIVLLSRALRTRRDERLHNVQVAEFTRIYQRGLATCVHRVHLGARGERNDKSSVCSDRADKKGVSMDVRSWKPIPFAKPNSPSAKAAAPKPNRRTYWIGACIVTLSALIFVAVFALTRESSSPPSPPNIGVMGMRAAPQRRGAYSDRRRMSSDAEAVVTEFICTNGDGTEYTPSIDNMFVNFMILQQPGFETGGPGGDIIWDWKKTNTSSGDVYEFDTPVLLVQNGPSNDPVALNTNPINSQADLVKRTSRFVSWRPVDETSALMGCTSMEEYVSRDGSYVCGPYAITISVQWTGSDGADHKKFPLFNALSQFIGGNYAHGILEIRANVTKNSNCRMVTRFTLNNPMGTDTSVRTWVSHDDADATNGEQSVFPGIDWSEPKYAQHSNFSIRFPGQGWVFGNANECEYKDQCWSQPAHTDFFSIWNPGTDTAAGAVSAFLKQKINESDIMDDKQLILDAWGIPANSDKVSSYPGIKLINKMFFESYGALFNDYMRHYVATFLTQHYKDGLIDEQPSNIDSELWATISYNRTQSATHHPEAVLWRFGGLGG